MSFLYPTKPPAVSAAFLSKRSLFSVRCRKTDHPRSFLADAVPPRRIFCTTETNRPRTKDPVKRRNRISPPNNENIAFSPHGSHHSRKFFVPPRSKTALSFRISAVFSAEVSVPDHRAFYNHRSSWPFFSFPRISAPAQRLFVYTSPASFPGPIRGSMGFPVFNQQLRKRNPDLPGESPQFP